MTIGPREMAALRSGGNVRWARIADRWDLAHHNLFRATKNATRAMQRLNETIERDKAAHPEDYPLDGPES